jgi:cytochrome d ubiquinol oxidase subunit II
VSLPELWFVLIAFFWAGYFLLEGFDFGVGALLPFLPRDERERRAMLDSIGPVWDGNEVWLVVAGAATFAAFPSGMPPSSRASIWRCCSCSCC